MHNHTMVIYILYKFHEIPSIGYLIMAKDQKTDWWTETPYERTDGQRQIYIPPPWAGNKNM